MLNYASSILILLIGLVLLVLALVGTVIAHQTLCSPSIDPTSTDVGYVKGTLMFFIIAETILILVTVYAIVKVRTSNAGGWFGFILALILLVFVLIYGISSIGKVNGILLPDVLKYLTFATIIIPISVIHIIVSIWVKPRIATNSYTKKMITVAKEKLSKSNYDETGFEEVDADETIFTEPAVQPVQPVQRSTRIIDERSYVSPVKTSSRTVPSRSVAILE